MKHIAQILMQEKLQKQADSLTLLGVRKIPEGGWINFMRKSLKIPLKQLAERLNIASPSAKQMEAREIEGAVTIKTMNEVAKALNLKFVYGFVPGEGSFQEIIDQRALEIAKYMTESRVSSIVSEDFVIKPERIELFIAQVAENLKRTLPRYFWSDDKDEWKKGAIKLIDLQQLTDQE